MCPFAGEDEFHDFLLAPASGHGFETRTEYIDLRPHNVLVGGDGHLAGFLDWESAGWYPEYWDFYYGDEGQEGWWLGGEDYRRELGCDVALSDLTVDSYVAF
jgi:hypothetical protein